MIISTSGDGHPSITIEIGDMLINSEPDTRFGSMITWQRIKDDVIDWCKEHVGVGRFQVNGFTISFLDESDRFHFVMRWR